MLGVLAPPVARAADLAEPSTVLVALVVVLAPPLVLVVLAHSSLTPTNGWIRPALSSPCYKMYVSSVSDVS